MSIFTRYGIHAIVLVLMLMMMQNNIDRIGIAVARRRMTCSGRESVLKEGQLRGVGLW